MFQMPSTKSSISFACFIRSKKLGSKYCMLKNEVVCSDSLRANSLTQQPACCGGTLSIWKEVTEMGGFCWSKNELTTSSKLEGIRERLCLSLPHVSHRTGVKCSALNALLQIKVSEILNDHAFTSGKIPFFSWPMLF